VPVPSASEVELANEKLKSHISPGNDQIPAELIKAGGRTICCEMLKLIISIWNKAELPEEWKESIIVPIYKKVNKTDCINYRGISLLPTTCKILSHILLSRLTPYAEEIIGDHQCGFGRNSSTTDIHSAFIKYLRKNGNTMKQCISNLQTSNKTNDLVRREVLYNILIEFGITMKLVRLIKNVSD